MRAHICLCYNEFVNKKQLNFVGGEGLVLKEGEDVYHRERQPCLKVFVE